MQEDLVLGEDPVMTMNIFVLFPHVAERENPGASFFLCVRALVLGTLPSRCHLNLVASKGFTS